MVLIPENKNTTLNKVDSVEVKSTGRYYLGMSNIGEKCLRKLQYDMHNVYLKTTPARIQRIFDRGHEAECYMIKDLRNAGLEIWDCLEEQTTLVGFGGHIKGHPDGKCKGVIEAPKTTHLLELKTHNDKSFKALKKETLSTAIGYTAPRTILDYLKASRLKHYSQVIRYMGAEKLTRGLYVAYNKNDSHYYIERIYENKDYYEELLNKERNVLLNECLFPRIGNNKATWIECKFCDAIEVCFGIKQPEQHCRTCENCDQCNDGKWKCSIDSDRELTFEEQMAGCEMYRKDSFLDS